MTKYSLLAVGSACALVLALSSAGCGRSSQSLSPDTGTSGSNGGVEAQRDGAEEFGDRGGDEAAHHHARPIDKPTTITQSGDYRLTADLHVDAGDAIVITASHVRLWLGQHRLYGPGNKLGRALVIDGAEDVVVRGGRVERFGIGAVLVNASRCRIRDLAIEGGDETADPANGNPPQIGIMLINSKMNYLGGNRMRNVNLGIFVRGGGSYENRIHGNVAVGGANGLLGICYNPAPGSGPAGPMKDRVKYNALLRFGTGISASAMSAENVFAMNTIRFFNAAYEDLNGTNVFTRNQVKQISP